MSKLEAKRFDQPDEVRPFTGHGHVDLVELSTGPVAWARSSRVGSGRTMSNRWPEPRVAR